MSKTTLTKDQSTRAIALGEHDGHGLLADIKGRTQGFDTEEEKLLWWAAFMGYLGGTCAADIGTGALQAVQQMTAKLTERVLQQHTN